MVAVNKRISNTRPYEYQTKIYQRNSEDSWTLLKTFDPLLGDHYLPRMRPTVTTLDNLIFLTIPYTTNSNGIVAKSQLWLGKRSGPSLEWSMHSDNISSRSHIVRIFDQIYLMGDQIPILKFFQEDQWVESFPERVTFVNSENNKWSSEAVINNTAYVLSSNILSFSKGVTSVSSADVGTDKIEMGQKNRPVLSFTVDVNREDHLEITLFNLGSAEQGKDLDRVTLARYDQEGNPEILGVFEVDPNDSQKWHLASSLPVYDGEQLFVMVDVAFQAREESNFIFNIQKYGLKSINNTDFRLENPMTTQRGIRIVPPTAAASLEPISEVIIYPQPARTNVVFAYDLTSPSDVTIDVFDRNSVKVARLKDLNKLPTRAKTEWEVSQLAKGVYYALIEIQSPTEGRRIFKKKIFVDR